MRCNANLSIKTIFTINRVQKAKINILCASLKVEPPQPELDKTNHKKFKFRESKCRSTAINPDKNWRKLQLFYLDNIGVKEVAKNQVETTSK